MASCLRQRNAKRLAARSRQALTALVACSAAYGFAVAGALVTHETLQAVDAQGHPTSRFSGANTEQPSDRVVVEGIALNNPEDMLDTDWEWQVFIQGEGTDNGGTAVWAGRFYYPSQEVWDREVKRLNAIGIRAGDRVRVSGWASAVGGKVNINERHSADPVMDFEISVLDRDVGLPNPESTTISEMNRFDPMRTRGGERYTSRRIRLSCVCLHSGEWKRNGKVVIADRDGNTLPLRLGNHPGFDAAAPKGCFDLVAIGNQEPVFGPRGAVPGTGLVDGYEAWITDPAGVDVYVPADASSRPGCVVRRASAEASRLAP